LNFIACKIVFAVSRACKVLHLASNEIAETKMNCEKKVLDAEARAK
jgi:hypothetical protein